MPQEIIDFLQNLFLHEGLLLLIGAFIVGQMIKSIAVVKNEYIPLIVGVLGAIVTVVANAMGSNLLPESDLFIAAFKGLAIGWGATGAYEMFAKFEWFQKIFGLNKGEDQQIINE